MYHSYHRHIATSVVVFLVSPQCSLIGQQTKLYRHDREAPGRLVTCISNNYDGRDVSVASIYNIKNQLK